MADSFERFGLPRLPPRRPESHKGDFGRALLIGGSMGMSGAIALAGMATLRSGAGLVRLAVPDYCLDVVASFEPSYMTTPLLCDNMGRITSTAKKVLSGLIEGASCVACGPGLGRSSQLTSLVKWLFQSVQQPLVLDADALFALSRNSEVFAEPSGPRIVTPHPGEFRRFLQEPPDGRASEEQQAIDLAARAGLVIVLKGHRTLVTDGDRVVHNPTGNPGMATGGSGDVLTGVITALICQGMEPFEAAQLGVYVHGLAGDLAARELGMVSLIASDLVKFLPQAFLALNQYE